MSTKKTAYPEDPYIPKNNWVMAEALRDGLTCRVGQKHMANVLEALDYHKISAVIEQEDEHHILVIPKP